MSTNPAPSSLSGYSPVIGMTLDVDGVCFPVWEVGPTYLVIESPHAIGPARGTLVITVNGEESVRAVSLPEGINPDRERQPLVVFETSVPAGTR